jgi:phosphoglycerate kinase|eukprot:evm.model.NODE_3135_length_19934_cov_30.575951.4
MLRLLPTRPLCRGFAAAATQQKKTIADLGKEMSLKGKSVFVRADLNVPVKGGAVKDKTRINLSAPTIQFLLDQGAKVVVSSHLGRPKGQVMEDKRLTPVAAVLQAAIKAPVRLAPDSAGPEAAAFVKNAAAGEVVLLENTRFHAGETKNDEAYAKQLHEVSGADIYVNDAFGAAHRAHASTHGITKFVSHKVAGLLLDKELTALGTIMTSPEHPVVACIGGSKVSTKLPVLESLLAKCDTILIGGGMMFTFSKAQGYHIGRSLVEEDLVPMAREFLAKAKAKGVKVVLPRDFVVAPDLEEASSSKALHADVASYKGDGIGVDIGPLTVGDFHNEIKDAKTFFWNGPMGVIEVPRYALGTDAVTRMAAFLSQKGGLAVVGGGDSLVTVQKLGLFDKITHVSTGGGAMLEFVEGKVLPGVEVLDNK